MGTALALPHEQPRAYSYTPKGKPHIRVLHVPYYYTQLGNVNIEVFSMPQGCQLLDWALDLARNEWIFVVDVSKEELDDKCEFDHNFDFRSMMRSGSGA